MTSTPAIVKISSDSELSEPEEGAQPSKSPKTKPDKASASKKKTTVAPKEKTPKSPGKTKNKIKTMASGTPNGKVKPNGKAKNASVQNGDKKPRAKPVKKPEVPVEPPAFEKVDTRLGLEEAQQRMQVGQDV